MNKNYENMMLLYSKLDINYKRNEFSSLLEKTNQLIDELLKIEQIEDDKLSDACLDVIRKDINSARSYGMECDKKLWLNLRDEKYNQKIYL